MKLIGSIVVSILAFTSVRADSPSESRPEDTTPISEGAVRSYAQEALAHPFSTKTDYERFSRYGGLAKASFVVGKVDDAKKYADELLALLPKFSRDVFYGSAAQDANLVLGRIAVQEGRIDEAKRYLIAAGSVPSSPVLRSFGPNLSLAEDLLKIGERDAVIRYLDLLRTCWKTERGKLDRWAQKIENGEIPDFGANLLF
jgi:hypothetical protein